MRISAVDSAIRHVSWSLISFYFILFFIIIITEYYLSKVLAK